MTNADKIRGMTTEELPDILHFPCPPDMAVCPDRGINRTCRECWLEWLNKEEGGDTNAR